MLAQEDESVGLPPGEGDAQQAAGQDEQGKAAVAALLASTDILGNSARPVLDRVIKRGDLPPDAVDTAAIALLVGPIFYTLLHGTQTEPIAARDIAAATIQSLQARPSH